MFCNKTYLKDKQAVWEYQCLHQSVLKLNAQVKYLFINPSGKVKSIHGEDVCVLSSEVKLL